MLKQNLIRIRQNIEAVCAEVGRDPNQITIVAASKTVPIETLNQLPELGITIAGENRVQELMQKKDAAQGLVWHMIGALQTNKVKYLIGNVALIQSVDRAELAIEIDRRSQKKGIVTDVLIEVNAGGESSKSGVLLEGINTLVSVVTQCKNIRLRGLMSVLPKDAPDRLYQIMQQWFKKMQMSDLTGKIDILSMGMSGDYEKAVRWGATMIRPGSALFGERHYNN